MTTKDKTRKEKIWEAQARAQAPLTVGARIFFALASLLRLKIALLHHRAMGRFYGSTEYLLRSRKLNPPKGERLLLVSGEPVNRQILTMVARRERVVESGRLWRALDGLRRAHPDHPIWVDMGCTGWLRGAEWTVPGPQLSFTPEEHERGRALLRLLGVPEGGRWVCFFAKDRLYTDSPDTKLDPASYWGSRDFRNCDIKNYLPAAEYLARQGMHVFRMGIHEPEQPLPDGLDARVVDYTAKIRPTLDDPDFADAYLQANCKFFLGTTSGIYILSSMFGVPVAYANMIPYGECGRMPHDIVIFKKCRDKAAGRFFTFPEAIARGIDADWLTLDELNKLDAEGLEFVENSGEEILGLAREMNERLDKKWRPEPDDARLHASFLSLSPAKCFDGAGFPGMVGAEFLRQNRALL